MEPIQLLILGVTWFVVYLFSTTLHEAAHAWMMGWASAPYDPPAAGGA